MISSAYEEQPLLDSTAENKVHAIPEEYNDPVHRSFD